MLTKSMKANMGIMITASHNPYYDNGIKLFGPDGMKLSDKIEKKIEKLIDTKNTKQLTNPNSLGRVKRLEDGNDRYIKILKKNFPNNFNLKGTKIVLDCGNGAGYIAGSPKLLKNLGAKVVSYRCKTLMALILTINVDLHIHLKFNQQYENTRLTLAFHLMEMLTELLCAMKIGKIIDGDQIIAMLARRWKSQKKF